MKILTIFAHPDDETMLTGGTLALLNHAGATLHFLCATRGEGGELGEPPLCQRDKIGLVREHELACAIQALGGGNLHFMGYADPLVGENEELYPYSNDFNGVVEKIMDYINQIQPNAILTHGANGEYGHPGHILTHQATRKAVETLGIKTPLYAFCADFPNHPRPRHANLDNPAHIILDVRAVMAQKEKAAYCHRTQHALFGRRSSQRAGYRLTIPEVLYPIESLHRVHPSIKGNLNDDLANLLKPWAKFRLEVLKNSVGV